MRTAARFGCVGVLIAMFPILASAQMGMHAGPAMRGILNPVVGSGGEYEMTTEKGTKMVMEVAIVGKESVGGKDGYWFETTFSDSSMGRMVHKTLTVVDGTDTVISRMIMQMGNRPPMEMPTSMMKSSAQKQSADIRIDHDSRRNFYCRALQNEGRIRRRLGRSEGRTVWPGKISRKGHHDGADQSHHRR
jgi:hypothetical protein